MKITKKQWETAQRREKEWHKRARGNQEAAHREACKQYFEYVGLGQNIQGKNIIEVGPGDYPALMYCENIGKSIIIEPLPSEKLKENIKNLPIELIEKSAENVKFPTVDEVWLFNVLQHVIDPVKIIENAKQSAKVIRFFEPINYGLDSMHLHNFDMNYFMDHFGKCVKRYPPNLGAKNFHSHECAYGVYKT